MKPLYHGTIYEFDEIDVTSGRGYKDFGKGFYPESIRDYAEVMPKCDMIIRTLRLEVF